MVRGAATFASGVAVGWIARSALGSTREAVVRLVVVTHDMRVRLRRFFGEQLERVEDAFAEGRAQHDDAQAKPPIDDQAPPRVTVTYAREQA